MSFFSFMNNTTKFLTSKAAAWLPVDLRKNLELGTQKVEKWVLAFFSTWSILTKAGLASGLKDRK